MEAVAWLVRNEVNVGSVGLEQVLSWTLGGINIGQEHVNAHQESLDEVYLVLFGTIRNTGISCLFGRISPRRAWCCVARTP